MHNVSEAVFDAVARPVVAVARDYPPDHQLDWHSHRRAQLLYGATGLMQVDTAQGSWTVPPQRAVWIPAGTAHAVRMLGVRTRSLYIEPQACAAMAPRCRVVAVTPLVRELLLAAVDLPAEYDQAGRDGLLMALLLAELAGLPDLPLHLPLPAHAGLRRLCRDFLAAPTLAQTPEQWAGALNVSLRTFARLFRKETGLGFQAWRQRACVLGALPRLAAGQPVTAIALDMGYDSPGAFGAMFRRLLGASPARYARGQAPALADGATPLSPWR
ncbi:helix-turn-helix transcriptional regulator [Orrella sp. JC864]|uniref:AraC family transcriptional regulator n=1 Tax=Orrella sp. JC864 TaxID=3120298 RepID=UPI0012BB6A3D